MLIQNRQRDIFPSNSSQLASRANITSELQQLAAQIKGQTGLSAQHLIPLQQVAHTLNCVIGFRPVDPLATELIEMGHPTKSMHIKGKSASWGPQAGLICVDQKFSKLENSQPEKIDTFNQHTQKCMKEGHAVSVPLTISPERLRSLLKADIISNWSIPNSKGISHFTSIGPSGKTYAFEAHPKDPKKPELEIRHAGAALQVLAPKQQSKPITADYDTFLIGPHLSDLSPQDNVAVPDVSHDIFKNRIGQYKQPPKNEGLRKAYADPKEFYQKVSPDIGNGSQREKQLISIINQAVVGHGEPVVHHCSDASSAVADTATNYPATFFLPKKLGAFEKICIINNSAELKELVKEAKSMGYHIPLNPLWEAAVTQTRRPSFESAKDSLTDFFNKRLRH